MQAIFQRWFPLISNLIRGREADRGTVELTRHRIYILPTRHGVLFAMFLLAMLLGSINYALSLGFVLTFLLGGVAVVTMFHTYRNLAGLRIASIGVKPVFAGEAAQFQFHIEANAPRAAIAMQLQAQPPVWADVTDRCVVSVPVQGTNRGWLRPPRFTVFTVYPLGLFRAWSYVDFGERALIYPRPLAGIAPPPSARDDRYGQRASQQAGADDFAGLRAYQPGDSPRHIAWKAAGKNDALLTKRFSVLTSAERWLDWEHTKDSDAESRLSRLAGWVLQAERDGVRYGLRLPRVTIQPARGDAHRHACLKALALFGEDDG